MTGQLRCVWSVSAPRMDTGSLTVRSAYLQLVHTRVIGIHEAPHLFSNACVKQSNRLCEAVGLLRLDVNNNAEM